MTTFHSSGNRRKFNLFHRNQPELYFFQAMSVPGPSRHKYIIPFRLLMFSAFLFLPSPLSWVIPSAMPWTDHMGVHNFALSGRDDQKHADVTDESDPVTIPLKRAGRLFLIEAVIDNEAGNLVFDTGARGIVLNNTYFRDYLRSGAIQSHGITGSVQSANQISVKKIGFGSLEFKNLRADVANLGHIENRRGMKILGLVGLNLMQDMEIIIDPARNQLILFRIDRTGKRMNSRHPAFKPDCTQKISGNSGIVFLKGTIGGKTLCFCFDTGAETNALSSSSGRNILETLTIVRRTTLRGTGQASPEVLYGKMNDFIFGNKQLTGMETIVTNLEPLSEAYGTHIDGMLGYTFLEKGTFSVNFVNNQFAMQFKEGGEE
jgi:predicted aspartyl protease